MSLKSLPHADPPPHTSRTDELIRVTLSEGAARVTYDIQMPHGAPRTITVEVPAHSWDDLLHDPHVQTLIRALVQATYDKALNASLNFAPGVVL